MHQMGLWDSEKAAVSVQAVESEPIGWLGSPTLAARFALLRVADVGGDLMPPARLLAAAPTVHGGLADFERVVTFEIAVVDTVGELPRKNHDPELAAGQA